MCLAGEAITHSTNLTPATIQQCDSIKNEVDRHIMLHHHGLDSTHTDERAGSQRVTSLQPATVAIERSLRTRQT